MIKAGIIGATGYAGEELVRLLSGHPNVEIAHVVSKSFVGKKLSEVYGSYLSLDFTLEDMDVAQLCQDCQVVFLGLPHGASLEIAPLFQNAGVKIIDLSGDFRYNDPDVYEAWYGIRHNQRELLKKAVYGLAEIHRDEIMQAELIANPGCYTTTSILPLYPLLQKDLVQQENIIIDAKSGVTGAGRKEKLAFSFCEVNESFKAYGVTTHRHTSEIEQELSIAAAAPIQLSFTPHLLPVKRGILATIYANLRENVTAVDISLAYEEAYGSSTFVHVFPHGLLPELKFVVGSNNCAIGYQIDKRLGRVVIVSCTDNLIKGAAGQAVQNMNLAFGLDETAGLPLVAPYL